MIIELATGTDSDYLLSHDKHLLRSLLASKIEAQEIYLLRSLEGLNAGWLRYGYFWDNTPFLNMIWLEEEHRNQGYGRRLVGQWENDMKRRGHFLVMTSTQANEGAQHFYRKLGYQDAGCLLLKEEPLEIILTKSL